MRTDEERLARWYRFVLLAYPRRYRRERAAEIVTTLLDAAAPGQRRPRPRDAANLVLRGLAARFAIPRGPEFVAPAVLVGLFGAVLAVAGATHLAWVREPALPSNDAALVAASAAVTSTTQAVMGVGASDTGDWFPAPAGFDHQPGSIWVMAPAGPGGLSEANTRLVAAGWRVTGVAPTDAVGVPPGTEPIRYFWATRADVVMLVSASNSATVDMAVHRRAAGWLSGLLAVAGLIGFAVGWRLAGGMLRAFRRHRLARRLAVIAVGGPGLLLAMMPTTFALALVVERVLGGGSAVPLLMRIGSAVAGLLPVTVPAVVLLVAAGVTAARRPNVAVMVAGPGSLAVSPVPAFAMPRVEPAVAWRLLSRAAVVAHGVFAALPVLLVIAYLIVAWRTGERPVTGLHDPKDFVPFGASLVNPFHWLYLVFSVGCLISVLVNPALAAVSVPLLVAGAALRLPRIGRAAALLACAVVASAAAEYLLFSPVGREALYWLAD